MTSKTLSSDPPWQSLKLSKNELQDLKSQWSILHLLHHRSQNQHRRSSWYRHFNMFRKQVRALVDELDPELPANALPSQKAKVFAEGMQKVEKRQAFWANVMVEKWYRAFSQLVGDQQFAVLGLTLLATLGRVVNVLDVLDKMKEAEGNAVKEGLREAAQSQGMHCDSGSDAIIVDHDLGVAVERSHDPAGEMDEVVVAVTRTAGVDPPDIDITKQGLSSANNREFASSPPAARPKKESSKKKHRRGDEIDDLFSGLI